MTPGPGMLTALCVASMLLAAAPAALFLANLRAYRPPGAVAEGDPGRPSVSVLIPARDEEGSIGAAVGAALASRGVDLEVIVLDDHSRDATAAVVRALAGRDPRVRLHEAPPLPEGWCGKQHACASLAALAGKPWLVFLDADVRLAPDALARMARFLDGAGADLASGVPRQVAVGLVEQMVIPLIHFILLGFLPLGRMRRRPTDPALAAGCGQLFVTRKAAYERAGGHGHPAVRASLHDGLTLPRAYRAAGLATDLFDATDLASCRMYHGPLALWRGLAKNAGEGLASPALIGPATVLLLGGQVLPFVLTLAAGPLGLSAPAVAAATAGVVAAYAPRLAGVVRFRHPPLGAALHPLGVLILLAIQWYAFARGVSGRPATWKGRPYPARADRPGTTGTAEVVKFGPVATDTRGKGPAPGGDWP